MPYVSAFLLGHELVHCCFGEKKQRYLARGLEDGICELVATWMCSQANGPDLAASLLLNMHIEYASEQMWAVYSESLRQAAMIYREGGIDGVMALIRRGCQVGRQVVKEAERECLKGNYRSAFRTEASTWSDELTRLLDRFTGYPFSLRVSPLAFVLAREIRPGESVRKLAARTGVSRGRVAAMLAELQDRVFLVLQKDNVVVSDETKLFLEEGALHYSTSCA
jgi:hypothetical protein